jgi:hypothetical protein
MDVTFDDEGLNTLERIFLLSRSEYAFHRAYVARVLGDLLGDVDPCESVEYVLPLISAFSLDEDESVKEAFAADLHRILWYFFTVSRGQGVVKVALSVYKILCTSDVNGMLIKLADMPASSCRRRVDAKLCTWRRSRGCRPIQLSHELAAGNYSPTREHAAPNPPDRHCVPRSRSQHSVTQSRGGIAYVESRVFATHGSHELRSVWIGIRERWRWYQHPGDKFYCVVGWY